MKKQAYARPVLTRYGSINALTQGAGGTRPDFLNGQFVNNDCFTFGSNGICLGTNP